MKHGVYESEQPEFDPPVQPTGGGHHDTRLEYEVDGKWHRVGEVQSAVGPMTDLDTHAAWVERVAVMVDTSITFHCPAPINRDIFQLLVTKNPTMFRLVYSEDYMAGLPDARWVFEGFVTNVEETVGPHGINGTAVAIDIIGEPLFYPGVDAHDRTNEEEL
jgi:hypothetical protein